MARIATLDTSLLPNLPSYTQTLFAAKTRKNLTFAQIGDALGRNEVAVAALFYGQAAATPDDVAALAKVLDMTGVEAQEVEQNLAGVIPNRGHASPMPPTEPLMYRLYEIVQNYGLAYKAVLNEKLGDGIMSAISFSSTVETETDDKGVWAVITLRGKWLPYTRF